MTHIDHWNNGSRLVSATELQTVVSKPFLDKWKESLCDCPKHFSKGRTEGFCGHYYAKKVAEEAGELGNKIDKDITSYFIDGAESTEPWSINVIAKLKENNVKLFSLIPPQSQLKDIDSNLAGSPDWISEDDKGPIIDDLKVKNSLDIFTGAQGYAYKYLINRIHKVEINRMRVWWCKKKTKSMLVEPVWIDLTEWKDDWYALVRLWNRANPSRRVVIHE